MVKSKPPQVDAPFSACHATLQPSTHQIAKEAFLPTQTAGLVPGSDTDMSKPYSLPGTEAPVHKFAAGAGPPLPPPNSGLGLISCPHYPISTGKEPVPLPTDVDVPIYDDVWRDVQYGVTWASLERNPVPHNMQKQLATQPLWTTSCLYQPARPNNVAQVRQ